jgi:hypothetical protein
VPPAAGESSGSVDAPVVVVVVTVGSDVGAVDVPVCAGVVPDGSVESAVPEDDSCVVVSFLVSDPVSSSANAVWGRATAVPMPRATANAPTRPTCWLKPMTNPRGATLMKDARSMD